MRSQIRFDFLEDNHYSELKDAEIMTQRITLLQQLDPYVGKYFSDEWVRREVLRQTEDEIKAMDRQMAKSRQQQIDFATHQGNIQVAQQQPMMDAQASQAEQQAQTQGDEQ
jgi:hypothetical protein